MPRIKGTTTIKWTPQDIEAWKAKAPILDIVVEAALLNMQPRSLLQKLQRAGVTVPEEQVAIAKKMYSDYSGEFHSRRRKAHREAIAPDGGRIYAGKPAKPPRRKNPPGVKGRPPLTPKERNAAYAASGKKAATNKAYWERKGRAAQKARRKKPDTAHTTPAKAKKEAADTKLRNVNSLWEAQTAANAKRERNKALPLRPYEQRGIIVRLDHRTQVELKPGQEPTPQLIEELKLKFGISKAA